MAKEPPKSKPNKAKKQPKRRATIAMKQPRAHPLGVKKRTIAKATRHKPVRACNVKGHKNCVQCDECDAHFSSKPGSVSSHFSRQHPVITKSMADEMKKPAGCPETGCRYTGPSANALIKHQKTHHGQTMSHAGARDCIGLGGDADCEGDTDDTADGITEEEKKKLGKGPIKEDDDDEDDHSGFGGSGGAGGVSQLVSVV
ncbi:hypothetical protein GGR57DRAFT_513648 [Xylariaceae sp. FL1272]|nr:hypothetical protein GGR57DRAFT_513648 [Xylariaceae sp. FL1272]